MKITLIEIKKAISCKNVWNRNIEFNGFLIRGRMFDVNSWQIVDSLDFNTCNIIKEFYKQDELARYILKELNNK
jgi:hypothetical protein